MIEIFNTQDQIPSDSEILSFWDMMFSPAHMRWDYDDNTAYAQKTNEEILDTYHTKILPRTNTIACWARTHSMIIGMASLNRFTETSRAHCAELGFSVREVYQRQTIGFRLVAAVIEKAREVGVKRIECSCFADNVASIALLQKTGFHEEGLRIGAIWKEGEFRDIHL
ncbi:MAG: GNAT family N-acetyltransferase, partial [Anaerolineae bacterium]|nr:GNAT family N-acetyltransferase [Anaerolineae bacterium]